MLLTDSALTALAQYFYSSIFQVALVQKSQRFKAFLLSFFSLLPAWENPPLHVVTAKLGGLIRG